METINDIVREMCTLSLVDKDSDEKIPGKHMLLALSSYADRIETAVKALIADRDNWRQQALAEDARANVAQSFTDCNQHGNAAKMREALLKILGIVDHMQYRYSAMPVLIAKDILELKQIAESALSAPARNCDVMSLESARKLWFAKEVVPRLNGDLPLGKEVPFEPWLFAEAKGETK